MQTLSKREKSFMKSISIDYVAGSHGNFLEYVCNKFIAGISIDNEPFNQLGASHNKDKNYYNQAVFRANHYSELDLPMTPDVIRIIFEQSDLLILSSISLLRAGQTGDGIDNNLLEIDTYNKLNNSHYKDLVYSINKSYPEYAISESRPDCPRFILREFFKFWAREDNIHGLLIKLKKITNLKATNIFDFHFKSFYNRILFLKTMQELADWYHVPINNINNLITCHDTFLSMNPYKNHTEICDKIINAVIKKKNMDIDNLTLFQEGYINGSLEKLFFGLEMPFMQDRYFKNTADIMEYIRCLE